MSASLEAATNAASLIIDHQISENNGDHTAIRFRDKRYSYHDLAALMNRAGNMMRRLGVNAGDSVLVAVAPSPSLIAGLLGAMKIGAVPVLLPGGIDAPVLEAVVSRHKPKLLIAEAGQLGEIHKMAPDATLVVVGEVGPGQRSFVQEMRESASSLSKSSIAKGAAALGVLQADEVVFVPHQELADTRSGTAPAIQFGGWDLGAALARFARGEEEVIG